MGKRDATNSLRPLALFCLVAALPSVSPECFDADIAIVLDVSESIRVFNQTSNAFRFGPDYEAFIVELTSYFDPLTNRVSLLSYSSSATIEQTFTTTYTELVTSLSGLVTTAQFARQNTDTGIALATELLSNSSRSGVPRYMLVFMDGTSKDNNSTISAIVAAGEANITIISVSLRGSLQEGLQLAGRSFRQFSVSTASELANRLDIIEEIASIICFECKGYSDVVFLMDGSDSTRRISADLNTVFYASGVVDLVKNVTANIGMGPIRASLISFSMTAQIIMPMTDNATAIAAALDSMMPEYMNTEAGLAFSKAREALDKAVPARPDDVPRYVIYLVDGAVSNVTDLTVEAQATRDRGIDVYAAGFGPAALFDDLMIATGSVDRIRQVDSDLELGQFVDPLGFFLCQTPPALTVA